MYDAAGIEGAVKKCSTLTTSRQLAFKKLAKEAHRGRGEAIVWVDIEWSDEWQHADGQYQWDSCRHVLGSCMPQPEPSGAEYVAIRLPAFSPELVNRDLEE